MKSRLTNTAFVALALLFCGLPQVGLAEKPLVVIGGGFKSADTVSGPAVDGLAFSLAATAQPKGPPQRYPAGHRWLSLELRNVSSETKYIKGFGPIWTVEAIVTDSSGNRVPSNPHPSVDTPVGPSDSSGSPVKPGHSGFMFLPIDAMMEGPVHGVYHVKIRALNITDAQTGAALKLESNTVTIQL